MGDIVSAFPIAGGIQVNRQISELEIDCKMVFPDDAGWEEALAAAGHFNEPSQVGAAPTIEDLRNHSALSRAEFLLRCVTGGILSEDEALIAAAGGIPASFAAHIDDWTPEYQFEAKLRWAALIQVDRNNPLILMLAAQREIPDEMLDALFGLPTGEPS